MTVYDTDDRLAPPPGTGPAVAAATGRDGGDHDAAEGVLEARGLVHAYGRVRALDGLNLRVGPGELCALVGPSGCGKTTALRALAGLERPSAGEVRLDGGLLSGAGTFVAPERRRVGLVFQDFALFPHLDVAGNVGYGVPRRERRARAAEMLDLVGLADLAGRRPSELSGGQQQRVALARALAPRPRAVLLDEPFSGLDAGLRQSLRAGVRAILRDARVATLLVTHDQDEALELADVLAVVRDGRVLQSGRPEAVYEAPADPWTAGFLGEAVRVPADVADGWATCALGRVRVPVEGPAAATGAVDLLVRPEAIVLADAGDGARATVRDRGYHGHAQVLDLALDDGTPARARWGPDPVVAVGDGVRVRLARALGAFPRGA